MIDLIAALWIGLASLIWLVLLGDAEMPHAYPPSRYCPGCRTLHNGAVVPIVCRCGTATIALPDYLAPVERTWRRK